MKNQLTEETPKTETAASQISVPTDDSKNYAGTDWMALLFHLLENVHWILLFAILCGAVAGVYVKYAVKPVYQTVSKIYIAGSETTISLADLQLGSSLAKDYEEVFKIWHVHEMVDERLNLNYSYSKLAGMVSVSNPSGSHLLYITVRSTDPEEAKMVADTYAEVVQDFIAGKMELRKPQLLEVAQLPTIPISPDIPGTIIKGAVMGGIAVAGIIILLYLLDDKIKSGDEIERVSGLPTLGILAHQEKEPANTVVAKESDYPPGAHIAQIRAGLSLEYAGDEAINTICSGIMFAGKNVKRIAVTSHEPNNGKTFISIHIAYSMANRGKKVLLIDCDLRKSALVSQYKISHAEKGLTHFLSGQCRLEDVLYPTNYPNFFLIPAGKLVKTPLPLLSSKDFEQLLDYAAENFDLVLLDTPPIGIVIDAAEIAKYCDGTLLVLDYNKQSKSALRYMKMRMEQARTPIIGCVLNNVSVKKLNPKRYYYQYSSRYMSYGGYSYYGEDGEKTEKPKKSFLGFKRRKQ